MARWTAGLGAVLIVALPAHGDTTKDRAERLLDTYTSAMQACDIAAFDELHADNLTGKGPGGSPPIDHVGLSEQCAWGAPDRVGYHILDSSADDGVLTVTAALSLTETMQDGRVELMTSRLRLISRLTANGDEQIIVSELQFGGE